MLRKYKNYLPSKKFALITLGCFAALGAIFFVRYLVQRGNGAQGGEERASDPRTDGTLVAINAIVEQDSDSDGIADWEESLWGTDPHAADTDGNGISDKAEIEGKKSVLAENSTASEEDLTETESFSRELFASITALKESGNLTNESIQDLVATISENAGESQIIVDTYTRTDLNIVTATPESRRAYHAKLLATLERYDNSSIGDELAIIDASLASEDESKLSELSPIAAAYAKLAGELAVIAVPEDAVSFHLELTNGAENTFIALDHASELYSNALVGLIGLSQYESQSARFDNSFISLQGYFAKNGIL